MDDAPGLAEAPAPRPLAGAEAPAAAAGADDAAMDDDDDDDGGGGGARDAAAGPSATFAGHTDSVYAVAASPTSPGVLLSGGGDDRAFLWRVGPGGAVRVVAELAGHTDSVASVGFSHDGQWAATGAYDGLVKLWDAGTGQCRRTLDGPGDVEWLDWHPKGNVLLAGSQDGTVWMWLALTGACMQVFAGHEAGVTCGGFTSDGAAVVTGSADGTVRVWAPRKGTCKHVFGGRGAHTCLLYTSPSPRD